MAQLDKLLSAMMTNHASALVLTDGEVVKLEIGGQLRPLTKTPLTAAQILALLQEVAAAHDQAAIEAGGPVEILRATPDGAFVIKGQTTDGKWRAVVSIGKQVPESKPDRPAPDASPAPKRTATPTPAPIPAAARPITAAQPAVQASVAAAPEEDLDALPWFEGIEQSRAMLDDLMRIMIAKGASDLHLRVGEPALLRHSGEMVRIEGQPVLVGSSRVDLQACKLEYSIVSPK